MNRTSGTKTFTFFSLTKGREKKGDDFSRRGASLPFLFFSLKFVLSTLDRSQKTSLSCPRSWSRRHLEGERETRRRSFREALPFRIKTKGRKENFDRGWKQRRNAGEYYESFFRAESRKSLSNPDVLRIKGWPTFLALLKTASPFHPFFEKFPRCFSTYLSELELGGRASFFFFIIARHIWLLRYVTEIK